MTKANIRYAKVAVAVVVVLSVVGVGRQFLGARGTDEVREDATFTVKRGDLMVTVTESGSIKAAESLNIKCELEGRATIAEIVPEGTTITPEDVTAGKVLVRLDSSDLDERLNRQEIEFATAEASLTEARESYDIQIKQNESDVAASELKVQFALMDLEKYLGAQVAREMLELARSLDPNALARLAVIRDPNVLGGESLQKYRQLSSDIELANERLKRAAEKYTWTQRLYEKEFVAKTELDADELAQRQQEIAREQAETARMLFLRYDLPKQVATLLSDYREALRELDRTRAQARSWLAQAEAKRDSAQARYDLQKQQKEKLEKQIQACTIRATRPGLVIYATSGDPWRRSEPIEVGVELRQGQDILTIPSLAEMVAEVGVHESNVHQVRPGQAAWVTVDAVPDRQFVGAVKKVAPLPDAQRGWLNPDLKVYKTQVTIRDADSVLQPDRSAKVKILIEQCQHVLYVPLQAVANRSGGQVCFVAAGSGLQERAVVTGSFNESFVVIEEGLKEGEKVTLTPPRLGEEPQATVLATGEPQIPADHQDQPAEAQAKPAPPADAAPQGEESQHAGARARMTALFSDPAAVQELKQAAQEGKLAEKLKEKGIEMDEGKVRQLEEALKQGTMPGRGPRPAGRGDAPREGAATRDDAQ